MGAFFSNTDLSTLRAEGNDTNCFVSLIVDTAGTYVAAITRKAKIRKEITTIDLGSYYEFFGECRKDLNITGDESGHVTEEIDTEEIQYFSLDVERHEVQNPLAFLDRRFDEIKARKNPPVSSSPFNTHVTHGFQDYPNKEANTVKDNFYDLSHPWEARKQKVKEPYLWDDATMDSITDEDAAFANWTPDKSLIHTAVCRMIACSLILNVEKFDLRQWITRHMNNVYDRIFPSAGGTELNEWTEFAVSFFVYHLEDPSAPEGISSEWYFGQIANAMTEELAPYMDSTKYPYIKYYIDELQTIIV